MGLALEWTRTRLKLGWTGIRIRLSGLGLDFDWAYMNSNKSGPNMNAWTKV